MALRIRFSESDLGKVTIAAGPDAAWEILLSLHVLQEAPGQVPFLRWRGGVSATASIRVLYPIAPPRGYSPDFLTPSDATGDLEAGIEAIRATPVHRLRKEIRRLSTEHRPPAWAHRLAAGDQVILRNLAAALRAYHRSALQPHWDQIEKRVHEDRLSRAQTLLDKGLHGLLSTLHPMLTWQGSTLTLHGTHVAGECRLDGRGLRLVPSFFCHGAPTVLADPGLPPVLVYPIAHDLIWLGDKALHRAGSTALATLLGSARARILTAAVAGCTTTELSRKAGVSVATASYHASILRGAGLIQTQRDGAGVRHTLTDVGVAIVNQH
jgi:DNA-binding transcriptional ArsR family regulator